MDTLVDPVEIIPASSSRLAVAKAAAEPARAPFPSLDPDAQVQWFTRDFAEEIPSASIDVDVAWDEENDTEPTLVLRRRTH